MNTTHLSLAGALLFLALAPGRQSFAAEPNGKKQIFPTLMIGEQLRTNVWVSSATPKHVTVRFEGGVTKLDRQDLPPQLAMKYPYDVEEAAEFDRVQAEKAKADQERKRAEASAAKERQRAETYKALLRQEKELERKTKEATDSLATLQTEINVWHSRPRGRGKMMALIQLRSQKDALISHIESLRRQLEAVRVRQAQYR